MSLLIAAIDSQITLDGRAARADYSKKRIPRDALKLSRNDFCAASVGTPNSHKSSTMGMYDDDGLIFMAVQ